MICAGDQSACLFSDRPCAIGLDKIHRTAPKKGMKPLFLATFAAFIALSSSVKGAIDYYINFGPTIPGESQVAGHAGDVSLLSFSFGTNLDRSANVILVSGRPKFQVVTVNKVQDGTSPLLFLACVEGTKLPTVVLKEDKAAGNSADIQFCTITLSDVTVSSISNASAPDDESVTESLTLNYDKIQISYEILAPDGTVSSTVSEGWDLRTNKPF